LIAAPTLTTIPIQGGVMTRELSVFHTIADLRMQSGGTSKAGSPAGCSEPLYSSDRQGFVIMMDKIPDRSDMIFNFF